MSKPLLKPHTEESDIGLNRVRFEDEREDYVAGQRIFEKTSRLVLAYVITGALFISIVISSSVWYGERAAEKHNRHHNVILMISDGFGPASETFARSYHQYVNRLPYNYITPLDTIHVGASRTRSSSSLVTDSAAGATAFACTKKTYNGAIAVDAHMRPCGTVLEAAKAIGMHTGLVVTSRITHATPAAFSAHVPSRDMESEIAVHQIGDYPLGRTVDLMFGGGRCFFLPNTTEDGCRTDSRNLIKDAAAFDWSVLDSRAEFDRLGANASTPLLGLFNLDHMSYEIDRDPQQEPSLREMAVKALDILDHSTAQQENGFFLMIEGSRIDMAAHTNDPVAHVHDIEAYQETVTAVKEYVDAHPGTVLISVSDHETGGLTLGRQLTEEYPDYVWYPHVIERARNSTHVCAQAILSYQGPNRELFVREQVLGDWLGILDPTRAEIRYLTNTQYDIIQLEDYLGEVVSRRALIGWTTHGHTGLDVNLYAYGYQAEELRGNHENTDIGNFITKFLDLNLKGITKQLENGIQFAEWQTSAASAYSHSRAPHQIIHGH